MTKAFEKIAAGLTDAIAYAERDTTKGRIAAGPDVKAIRAKSKLTQTSSAATLRVPVATIRDWEQHRRAHAAGHGGRGPESGAGVDWADGGVDTTYGIVGNISEIS